VSRFVEEFEGDMLVIFDCCYAAAVVEYGSAECLAATSSTEVAALEASKSLLSMLCRELRLAQGCPMTIAKLYARIVRTMHHAFKFTPVLVPHKTKDSIVLARLGPFKQNTKFHSPPREEAGDTRVLISAHIKGTLTKNQVDEFKRWIGTNIPPAIESVAIKVEGVFDTTSSIMLLSLPVDVWAMVRRQGLQFVALTMSGNKLLFPPPAVLSPVPIRGRENVNMGSASSSK
jgi:hypothetical protein